MNRRQFVAASTAAGIAQILGAPATGSAGQEVSGWGKDFGEKLARDSRLLGWSTPQSDRLESIALEIEGNLPEGLRGVFRRNGPAAHSRHGHHYRHWFDGDGMIQEFRFSDAGLSHRGRMIATPKIVREDAAGSRLFPGFATPVEGMASMRGPDDMNAANISVIDHHGELMALWEGGSASVLERETLDWKHFKSWGGDWKGTPFTAHPKVEADGTLWAFGYAMHPSSVLILYHVSGSGGLIKAAVIPERHLGMVHDFVVTSRHLVLVIPPFEFDLGRGGSFLDSHVWRPELGSRALVVSKDDFDDRRWVQLPAGFGFHHGNGWEDSSGNIHFDHCISKDVSLVDDAFRHIMRGEFRHADAPRYTEFVLHADGRVDIEESREPAEFPQIAGRLVGLRNRFVFTLGPGEGLEWIPRTLDRRDHRTGVKESYDFGDDRVPEEHVFVPFPEGSAEDDGWLVGTFLAHRRGISGVTVFDARGISDGPIATAWLPYPIPLGFHGQFSST